MLPVVASLRRTTREILLYTVLLVAVTLLFAAVAHMGALLHGGRRRARARSSSPWPAGCGGGPAPSRATARDAMRLFGYSITYLTLLFVAMAGDILVRYR